MIDFSGFKNWVKSKSYMRIEALWVDIKKDKNWTFFNNVRAVYLSPTHLF